MVQLQSQVNKSYYKMGKFQAQMGQLQAQMGQIQTLDVKKSQVPENTFRFQIFFFQVPKSSFRFQIWNLRFQVFITAAGKADEPDEAMREAARPARCPKLVHNTMLNFF